MKKYLGRCPWTIALLITFMNAIYPPSHVMAKSGLGFVSVGRERISLGSLEPLWNDLPGLKLSPNSVSDSLYAHDLESPTLTKPQVQWLWQGLALLVQRW